MRTQILQNFILKLTLLVGMLLIIFTLGFTTKLYAQEGGDSSAQVESTGDVDTGQSPELDAWLNTAINILSALVGLTVTGSIIFGGVQYMTARDNASQVSAAKERIALSVLSLLLFFFGYALLQWLVPGGIF